MSLTSDDLVKYGYSRRRILKVYAAVLDAFGISAGLNSFTRPSNDLEHHLVSYFVTQSISPNPSREHRIAIETCHQLLKLAQEAGDEMADRFLPLKRSDISVDKNTGAVTVYVSLRPSKPEA